MDEFLFFMICAFLTGFSAGIFGSMMHQYFQRIADEKRWNTIKREFKYSEKDAEKIYRDFLDPKRAQESKTD